MRGSRRPVGILTLLIVIGMLIPAVFAAEFSREAAAKYILDGKGFPLRLYQASRGTSLEIQCEA